MSRRLYERGIPSGPPGVVYVPISPFASEKREEDALGQNNPQEQFRMEMAAALGGSTMKENEHVGSSIATDKSSPQEQFRLQMAFAINNSMAEKEKEAHLNRAGRSNPQDRFRLQMVAALNKKCSGDTANKPMSHMPLFTGRCYSNTNNNTTEKSQRNFGFERTNKENGQNEVHQDNGCIG